MVMMMMMFVKIKNPKEQRSVIKRGLMFENYTDCLFNNKIILQSQQRFKSDHHDVYTEQINKIALSKNVDKRLQRLDRVTTYPHGTNAFKEWESWMLLITHYYKHDSEDEIMFGIWYNKDTKKSTQK